MKVADEEDEMGLADGKVALISGVAHGHGRSRAVRLAEEINHNPMLLPEDLITIIHRVSDAGQFITGQAAGVDAGYTSH